MMNDIPSHAELSNFLATAQQTASAADHILLNGFGKATTLEKFDGTLVTDTDRAVDAFVVSQLVAAYPAHAVLSEENNTRYDASVPFTWIVDPLDGTTNFARGLPVWGISIALLYYGFPVVGVLSFSSLRERYSAIYDGGAYLNDRPIQTSPTQRADDQHFMMICTRTPRRYRIDSPLKPRIYGSAAYHLAAVACGSALAGIEATPKLWDIAAALLIVVEAGGCYRCLDQRPTIFPLDSENMDYLTQAFPLITAANQSILSEMEGSIERY
jgi:myo-inositol-1(or 4)-monophosphatase